jgi:succinoglycan biosynthesis protein ExoW
LQQSLPADVRVHVVVVDDGSPQPASLEVAGLPFAGPFTLEIVSQSNGGVAKARNAGLESIKYDVNYVAFLDSDDVWHAGHLAEGIDSLERGNDFFFCDNRRMGHHDSQFRSNTGLIVPFLESRAGESGEVRIGLEDMTFILLTEFPSQLSTILFRWEPSRHERFMPSLVNAGEDMVYILQIIHKCPRLCFSPDIMVDCGKGVNLYYDTLSWDNVRHLSQKIDRLRSHYIIKQELNLSKKNAALNSKIIRELRKNVAFQTLRRLAKDKLRFPPEIKQLAKEDRHLKWWLPLHCVGVGVGLALKTYRPA